MHTLWKTAMRRDGTRPPIGFRQLCAIARELLTDEPGIDDADWREAIKCRIIALGYTYPPQPQTIPDAMARVERACSRPVPVLPSPGRSVSPRRPVHVAGGSDRRDQAAATEKCRMTALEKLTMSRLEDRVDLLEATVEDLVGRVELLEQVTWATADACGALLVRVEDLEARDRVGHTEA
jgi:hypothetical protein